MLAPSIARAGAEDPKVAAEALFGEGRALFRQGDYAGACAKFAESNRLDPAVGTEFNLADCEEHLGHLATSWAHWRHVVDSLASRPGDVRAPIARDHVANLEPRLPRLVITLAPGAPPRTAVTLDDLSIAETTLGSPLPADPGTHAIVVDAPGRQEARVDVELKESESRTVFVAPGDLLPVAGALAAPSVETAASGSPDRTRRIVSVVTVGMGVVGLGVGSAFGLSAASQWSSAQRLCPSPSRCDPAAETTVGDARFAGNVSTAAFITGSVLVAAGVVLWLTAPRARTVGVVPLGGAGFAGAGLVGRFE